MERLGLENTHQNIKRPDVLQAHVLSERVLYAISRDQWQGNDL